MRPIMIIRFDYSVDILKEIKYVDIYVCNTYIYLLYFNNIIKYDIIQY